MRNQMKVILVFVTVTLAHDGLVMLKICQTINVKCQTGTIDGESGSRLDRLLRERAEYFTRFFREVWEQSVFSEMCCEAVNSHLGRVGCMCDALKLIGNRNIRVYVCVAAEGESERFEID